MFDLAKKDTENSSKSVKFWDEVEKKNIIPDRTSQSLRTAWRKFSKYGEEQFISEALKDPKVRFSHQFEAVPYLNTQDKPKPKCPSPPSSDNESSPEREKALDMEVQSQEASSEAPEVQPENEDMEFLLAVDDLQSAISFNDTDDRTYSLTNQKKVYGKARLSDLYGNSDEKLKDHTRSKLFDTMDKENDGPGNTALIKKMTFVKDDDFLKSDSTTVYNEEELQSFLTNELKITINRDPATDKFSVKTKVVQKSKDEFFDKLSKELRDLAKDYGKEMDEIHMLFMEVS